MGKSRPGLAVAAGAVLAAFALGACGGDDGGSQDEDQISAAIERAATSGDPAACSEVQTVKFVQQTSGEPGDSAEEALQSCQQEAGDSVADSVDVSDIEVDGDSATAKAAVAGSFFDGQTLDIALVKEGDRWKLDEFRGFEDFDRGAMANAIRQELSQEEGASPQAVDCVAEQIESQPEDRVEAAFAGNDPKAEQQLFEPCTRFFNE